MMLLAEKFYRAIEARHSNGENRMNSSLAGDALSLDMVGVVGSSPIAPTSNLLIYNELLVREV